MRTEKRGRGYGINYDSNTNGYIRNIKIHLAGPTFIGPSWQEIGMYFEEHTNIVIDGVTDIVSPGGMIINWDSSVTILSRNIVNNDQI